MALVLGEIAVDLETGDVSTGDLLTAIELRLLRFLAEHPGRHFQGQELLRDVWGYRASRTNTVKTTINRLRAKLGPDGGRHLQSARGRGYWLVPTEAPRPAARLLCLGREDELAELRARLDAGGRVVTLLGPTGIGKTHLASVLAAERHAPIARLAELSDLDGLSAAVAGALGVAPATLGSALARTSLLVLDNAEHLPGLASSVSGWLRSPLPQLLITSQIPLDLPEEHLLRLGPLAADASRELLLQRAARHGSSLDAEDPSVPRLVAHTEGLPLGIELAAARVAVTGPAMLAEDPALLDEPWAGPGPERHSGLDAAVAWTWALLPESAQADLHQLAWFAHGFTAEGAMELLGGGARPTAAALVRLQMLVRHSCLREVGDGRLALYAPVRRFARARGDRERARSAYVAWVAGVASTCFAQRNGPDSLRAKRRLHALEPDICAALEAGEDQPDPELLEALAWLVAFSNQHERRIALARRWPTTAFTVRAAQSLRHLGRSAEAWAQLEGLTSWEADRLRSILAREAGDYDAAIGWLELRELDEASAALDRATVGLDSISSLPLDGVALRYRGVLALLQGRCEDGLESTTTASTGLRRAGQRVQQSIALSCAARSTSWRSASSWTLACWSRWRR